MIDVSYSKGCAQLMRLLELSPELAVCTVNEKDVVFIDSRRSRLVACRWFSEETVILVDAVVEQKSEKQDDEDAGIGEVAAQLVLELRPELPAGRIGREMDMEEILAVVAQSFGLPIRCATDEPYSTLYTGGGELETVSVQAEPRATDFCVIGTYRSDNYCELVWAFDVKRYREWFSTLLPGTKGLNRCGTVSTWLQHRNVDWTRDSHRYIFHRWQGPVGITIQATKQPDKTLVLRLTGPFARVFTFRQPTPSFDRRGVHIGCVWNEGEIKLFLNGHLVETRHVGLEG